MCEITLYNDDCLLAMRHIPDKSVDMVLCDLPYGTTACRWDVVIPFDKLWEQYHRIVKDGGAIVLFGSEPFSSLLVASNLRGFRFSWVWNKKFAANFVLAKFQPMKIHENILVFSKSKSPLFNPQKTHRRDPIRKGGNTSFGAHIRPVKPSDNSKKIYTDKCPESIISFPLRKEKRYHPTQKPVALLEYLIKTYSNEGDTILDNTMGSGSTGVAAVRTNRNFIGIEKDSEYYRIAQTRIYSTQKPLPL